MALSGSYGDELITACAISSVGVPSTVVPEPVWGIAFEAPSTRTS